MEINCTNQTPDLFNLEVYLKRINRGHFVLDGIVTVGADLTDQTLTNADIFYSSTAQHFVRTPFVVHEMSLSEMINSFFKDMLFESLKDCITNLPINDRSETFVPPLTKRIMILENCEISNDNMPSHMRPGYYNVQFGFKNEAETIATVLAKVEPK